MSKKEKFHVVRFVNDGFDEVVSGHRTRKTAQKAAVRLRLQERRANCLVKYYVVSDTELPWS